MAEEAAPFGAGTDAILQVAVNIGFHRRPWWPPRSRRRRGWRRRI